MANETLKGGPFPDGQAGLAAKHPVRARERGDPLEQELADEKLAQDKKETEALGPSSQADGKEKSG